MSPDTSHRAHSSLRPFRGLLALAGVLAVAACASSGSTQEAGDPELNTPSSANEPLEQLPVEVEMPAGDDGRTDPRVGLRGGLLDAEEAAWNVRLVSSTPPPEPFVGSDNTDLAFTGKYVIQGNYNGFQVWDISDPAAPVRVKVYVCPASQSDVSVYRNLLFVSGEGLEGRLDCGTEGVDERVSKDRLRGIRIFDISDIENPVYVGNVQTCRGSHTHSVLVDPDDPKNVYVYVSGSAPVRPAEELPGCSGLAPDEDPNTALFRIEVIRVPLDDPAAAEIVSSPRIFEGLVEPPEHGPAPGDLREIAEAPAQEEGDGPRPGPTQCHDITVYPEIGLAGGACEGYGLLIDISDPENPTRLDAVADSNFSYWHSATFSNDGSKILFSDEWGGGSGAKCRHDDPYEWGANAIFTVAEREMEFGSYFKMPAPQTPEENCVAHNGSLIPIPGRDVMVQGWYQGGVSVFDFTDPAHPVEIAFFDRGPVDPTRMADGGSWSAYWYNGYIVNSEIARGLDILELVASELLSANEIEAARTVRFEYFNVQGQQKFRWPATFALARAYVDQLERSGGMDAQGIARTRSALAELEDAPAQRRAAELGRMASHLEHLAGESADGERLTKLADTLRKLADV